MKTEASGYERIVRIRNILKEKDISSIWNPPSAYPEFVGVFSYTVNKKAFVAYI